MPAGRPRKQTNQTKQQGPSFGNFYQTSFVERVRPELLSRLLALERMNGDPNKEAEDERKIRESLLQYLRKSTNKCGKISVTYTPANGFNEGRLFADSFSLQNMPNIYRGALIHEDYYDIDMVNAGPNFLLQYCRKNGIELPNNSLRDYVRNRDKILKNLMKEADVTKKEAKKLIISVLYGGDYHFCEMKDQFGKICNLSVDDDILFLESLQLNFDVISKAMVSRERALCDFIRELNPDCSKTALRRKLVAYQVQRLEAMCLNEMVKFFKKNKCEIGSLMFDGLLLHKDSFSHLSEDEEPDFEQFLSDCSEYVMEKTGYKVKLIEKPIEGYVELPPYSFWVPDENEAALKLLEICGKNKFVQCNNNVNNKTLFVFSESDGLFYECGLDSSLIKSYITKNKNYLNYCRPDSKNDTVKVIGNYASEKLSPTLTACIGQYVINNNWERAKEKSSIGKILFNNGIYDMDTGIFSKEFDPEILFFHSTRRDFVPRTPENSDYIDECIKYANDLTFLSSFFSEEQAAPCKKAIAKALYGDITGREIYFLGGKTAAGKSKLFIVLGNCFGDYIGTYNAESLAYNTSSGKDEAAKNSWILNNRYRRILACSEPQMLKDLSGNTIKKVTGGGEAIEARAHFKAERSVVPYFTLFMNFNQFPKVLNCDAAVQERSKFIEFPKSFVSNPDPEIKYEFPADPDLDTKIQSEKFLIGFTHLILDAYRYFKANPSKEHDCDPFVMKIYLKDSIIEDPAKLSVRVFKFTENFREHKLTNAQLEAYRKKFFEKVNYQSFLTTLKSLGAKEYRTAKARNLGLTGIQVNDEQVKNILEELNKKDEIIIIE